MKIHFYAESDLGDYKEAVSFYDKFWKEEGDKIVRKWEEITGLEFYETEINASVGNFRSFSHPLLLRFDNTEDVKKSTLIHELGHRILYKRVKGMGKKTSLEVHKFLDLVLYDVFVELYGIDFTDIEIKRDGDFGAEHGQFLYKEAWDWALQNKTKKERQKVFNDILEGKFEL